MWPRRSLVNLRPQSRPTLGAGYAGKRGPKIVHAARRWRLVSTPACRFSRVSRVRSVVACSITMLLLLKWWGGWGDGGAT